MEKIILAMICALTLTLSACEKKETKKPSAVKPPEASGIISNKVPQAVVDLATGPLTDFGKDKVVVKAVSSQNAEAKSKAQIQDMDKKWQAAKKEGKTEPYMKALMENACAKQLNNLMAKYPSITEIFVTDNQGANVCQTALTGDYWQGDEAKFKEVFKKGILVSHPKLEDGMNITQVSVPVMMKTRHIGTMTIGVNIDKVPGAEPAKKEADKPAAAAAVAEKAAPAQEKKAEAPKVAAEATAEVKEQAPESAAVKEKAPEAAAPVQEVAEKAPQAVEKQVAVEEKVEPSQEKAPEKEAPMTAQVAPKKAEKEAPMTAQVAPEEAEKKAVESPKAEPPSELVAEAQESAAKVTEQVEAVEDTAQKASEELETLPAQAEKIQQEAEAVQHEVEKVAAQVKMVSEKVEKVSMDSQKVLDKARSAMEQILKARAQLREAADQIQKSAALMTQKLAEIESLTGVKTPAETPPAKSE